MSTRPAAPAGPDHLDALDVVRPVTAAGVIATHTTEALAGANAGSTLALAALHATRHIFFIVSAMVLVHAHYTEDRFSACSFWRRRLRQVVAPYVAWTVVYYLLSGSSLTGLDLTPRPDPASLGAELHQLVGLLLTGTGHLYFIVVLIQFYVVFPLFLGLLKRTHRWHLLIVLASLALQVYLDEGVHHGWLPAVFLGTSGNRQIALYQFYLVAGGVAGARARQLERWAWRWRWVVGPLALAACVAIECRALVQLHQGVAIPVVGDPFAPIFIVFNVSAFSLLALAGMCWARSERGWLRNLFRSASANSYGVYLVHPLFLDLFTVAFLAPMVDAGDSRSLVVLLGVASVYAAAVSSSALLARLPLLSRLVDRGRLGLFGNPAPVGRG